MDQDVYDNLRLGCDVGSTQELFGFHNTERAPQLQNWAKVTLASWDSWAVPNWHVDLNRLDYLGNLVGPFL